MKMFKLFLALLLVAAFMPLNPALASREVSAKEARQMMLKKALGHQTAANGVVSAEKHRLTTVKAARLMFGKKASGVDFNDPVDKWLWFWIFAWGIALVLQVLAWGISGWGVGWLSYLFWVAGTVCAVVWILKKFGNM